MTAAAPRDRVASPSVQGVTGRTNTVKARLTANRTRRVVENNDYAAFTRRVASGDVEALTQMTALVADLDTAIGQAVTGLRAAGYSWADIGLRLAITRQAAQQRWDSYSQAPACAYKRSLVPRTPPTPSGYA